jgi:hypothetical protein
MNSATAPMFNVQYPSSMQPPQHQQPTFTSAAANVLPPFQQQMPTYTSNIIPPQANVPVWTTNGAQNGTAMPASAGGATTIPTFDSSWSQHEVPPPPSWSQHEVPPPHPSNKVPVATDSNAAQRIADLEEENHQLRSAAQFMEMDMRKLREELEECQIEVASTRRAKEQAEGLEKNVLKCDDIVMAEKKKKQKSPVKSSGTSKKAVTTTVRAAKLTSPAAKTSTTLKKHQTSPKK